ncbi:MAG: T9SS type A sorting domain-containing protein [Bacteroidia bacterium]
MKKKIITTAIGVILGLASLHAVETGGAVSCTDVNGFVNHKNVGPTGYYTLTPGYQEEAAETYHYSGPGEVSSVRVYGNYDGILPGMVGLKVGIYNVDASGRPTTLIQSQNATWWWYDQGYITVTFPHGGVTVSNNFAVEVQLASISPVSPSFQLQINGSGEGEGQDLASLAGTSTGDNWTSAMTSFGLNEDFYLVPVMKNFITAGFTASTTCASPSQSITFTNTTKMSTDSMFNIIGLAGYTGSAHYYQWDFGDNTPLCYDANPSHAYAMPGAYTVKLTSTLVGWNNTCYAVKTMRISVGIGASIASVVNVTCNGLSNGSFVALGSGGIPSYSYSIDGNNYQPGTSFTGLPAGNYTLYLTDSMGCSATADFNITQPAPIVFSSTGTTNASCGTSDGSILVGATGGAGGIQYQLNSNAYQSSGSFTGLSSGFYVITAKDANGCTLPDNVTVNDVGGPTLSIMSQTDVSCNAGNDATIVLNATGGSGVLQYSINRGLTFQTSGSFSNLTAGTYNAMVKDAAGCKQAQYIVIQQPPAISLTASSSGVTCNGGSDGTINVTSAIGGTGAYSYSIDGKYYYSITYFPYVSAGTYTVYVKDAAGCIGTTTTMVTQPAAVAATVSSTGTSCNGSYDGSINIAPTGGTGSYSFSIGGDAPQNTGVFSDLPSGTYTVTVTDQNNCSYTTTTTVTQPTEVTASINTTSATCGNTNGGFLAKGTGGSGSGYTYSLNDTTFNSTGSFTDLSAGNYYVIVKDGSGCTGTFPLTISDANGPVISASTSTNIACNGGEDGTITVSLVTGGTGTLQYSVNGTNWQTSNKFTELPSGIYTVTVKDANGCTGTKVDTLTEPSAFVITTNITNLSCNGENNGAVTVLASGGAGTLAYSINGGSSFQSSDVFTDLAAGSYDVTIRDAAGCESEKQFIVAEPLPITMQSDVLNVTCHGQDNGSIELLAKGGTTPYEYSLNGTVYQTSNMFTSLSGGSYTGYMKDANGCITTIPVTIIEPAVLAIAPSIGDVSCSGGNNGFVTLTLSGGTTPYTYQWSNEATTQNIFNLPDGKYSVKVTDNNGCIDTATYDVTQPASPIVVNGVVTNASSGTSTDGSVSLSVTGGTSSYTFSWSNGETTQNLTGAAPGNYTVTVTDNNGCISTMSFTVNFYTGIPAVSNNDNVTLYPNPTSGEATVDAQNNVITSLKVIDILGQVMYQSEPQQSKTVIKGAQLAPGIYFVQVLVNDKLTTMKMNVIK